MVFTFGKKKILDTIIYIPSLNYHYIYSGFSYKPHKKNHGDFFKHYGNIRFIQKIHNFIDENQYEVTYIEKKDMRKVNKNLLLLC